MQLYVQSTKWKVYNGSICKRCNEYKSFSGNAITIKWWKARNQIWVIEALTFVGKTDYYYSWIRETSRNSSLKAFREIHEFRDYWMRQAQSVRTTLYGCAGCSQSLRMTDGGDVWSSASNPTASGTCNETWALRSLRSVSESRKQRQK